MLDIIKKEIESFENNTIDIVDNLKFSQKDTLRRIYYYYNSKYETGELDDQGDKKYFFNLNRNPCNVGTKAIDFDTKNINIQTAGGGTPLKTWYFERDLKFWMKAQKFGKVLNRIFQELPILGSVVLKIIDGKIHFVDLRNFIVVNQDADTLDQTPTIEIHRYTPDGYGKVAKKMKWKYTKDVIEAFRDTDEPYIKVYERYGEVEKATGVYEYQKVYYADVGKDNIDKATQATISHPGILLGSKKVDKNPYREFHWEKIPGRWLGVGRVEILFDPQIRVNEISNQEVKSSYYSTLRLWQTRDEGINRNLLTDVQNGEILNVESEITQVDMADRNLAYYAQEIARWMGNRDELTFSYDVVRGERLPAGTPLGSARLAAGMVGSYFDQIRENVAMDIKDLLYDIIIPQFKKENTQEHILRLAGEDLDKVRSLLIEEEATAGLFGFIKSKKKLPTKKQFEIMKVAISERVKRGIEKLVKIPAQFYENIKYQIEIDIVGEAIDTNIRAANKWMALQAVAADPTLLSDPTKKKFFSSWLEDGGLHIVDFEPETALPSMGEMVGRAGGGISRPVIPSMPTAGAAPTRL